MERCIVEFDFLCPYPRKIAAAKTPFPKPDSVSVAGPARAKEVLAALRTDLRLLARVTVRSGAAFRIHMVLRAHGFRAESYRLRLGRTGATIYAGDEAGLFYGVQTLLQFFVLAPPEKFRPVLVDDWPQYRYRSFMIDLGRAVFPLPLLKRVVRILARLKMNLLHLHLTDDQLGGLRFRRLPLGSENPFSLTMAQLGQLVKYARRYHVTIMPEIECWGHAGSMIYHFPELYGGPGMWGGMSFGMGDETYDLFRKLFDELVPALEPECLVHVGLDEAVWATLKSVPESEKNRHTPSDLVRRLDEILYEAGRKHGRRITMHLWADHGGRPVPRKTMNRVVIAPWQYQQARERDIDQKVKRYGGRGKLPFMMGGGASSVHFHGHFGATRRWCRRGMKCPNVEGITVCMWESNDLAGRFIGLYAGADFAWTPETPVKQRSGDDPVGEILEAETYLRMRKWQALFRDGDPEAINAERGPEVFRGLYCWGDRAGKPVAPTAVMKAPQDIAGAAEL
jgi:hypothetical protein